MGALSASSNDRPAATTNRVKQCFRDGGIALNSYVGLSDPALVEIVGLAGFDAVTIDLEHMTFDLGVVQQMIVAAEVVGITSVVRVPFGDWHTVLRVLDSGAQGIQITHVRDGGSAQAAVDAVRYPPLGKRGALGASRAARFGTVPWDAYVEQANREILLVVLIEDVDALDHVEQIASVEGVDLITVGPLDLAESMDIHTPDDPRVYAAIEQVAEQIRSVGNARLGLPVGHASLSMGIAAARELGASWVNVSPPPEVCLRQLLSRTVEDLRREAAA